MSTNARFLEAYKTLNAAQKKAVDTIEGPVLVIAGPGTGKTHILTLRVANILKETQANPSNILVLTFTDSAARTVRKRLGVMLGEATARDVNIFTFHGFCDYILRAYPDFFPAWSDQRLAGDVESALLWRDVLETEDITWLRTPKSPYLYLPDLERLAKDLARERISLDQYRAWGKEEEDRIKKDESSYYTRDSKYGAKGELKQEAKKKLERLEKVYEAANLIEAYIRRKEAAGVYDFSDVLKGVVDALETDEALQATLQEQFQYVLADEHQDANAYQHALLDTLAYDEHPNLFVVGDEKQAIFRFQGADSTHFREFLARYPRTTLINLTESFRSLPGILDVAHGIAQMHIPPVHGEHEPLSSSRKGQARLGLISAPDPLAERDMVASLVEEALEDGIEPHEVAIIAARNFTADRFAEHLAARKLPVLRAGDVALSSRPLVRAVLALLRAVANPLDMASLREALLAPWWEIGLPERAELLARTRDKELLTELTLHYPKVAGIITELEQKALTEAPLQVFSRVLASSGARNFALSHPNHLEDVLLLRRVYGYFEEVVARDTSISFKDAVESLGKAHEHGLEWVKSSLLFEEGRVTVITAHRAKGMEFKRVFVVGLTENEWERGKQGAKIPSPVDMARSAEDAARQFYVAITRAKDCLILSYAQESLEGRERKPSAFIPTDLPAIEAPHDPLPALHTDVDAPKIVTELTRTYLMGEGLSPSALADYLDSPATFFARRVLHLREPEQARMVIGTAVHDGIAAFLETGDDRRAEAALRAALARSLLPRTRAYDQACEDARARLSAFLKEGTALGTATAIEKTYRHKRTVGEETVNLSGKVDAVLERDGKLRVVDFKTSTNVSGEDAKFALQLAFYDYLLRENGEMPEGASLIQVRPDGINEVPVTVTEGTRKNFLARLDAALAEMLSGKWRAGETPSEYDDLLRLFA